MVRSCAAIVALLLFVLAGCSSEQPLGPHSADGVGGLGTAGSASAGTGGAGTGGAGAVAGAGGHHDVQPLLPDMTGWIDIGATGSTEIHGAWFAYSDGVGSDGTAATGDCEWLGSHPVHECSQIVSPAFGSFPNLAGKMCTQGVAAQIANIVGESIPDYDNIWGGGIGLGLNATGADNFAPYNAVSHQVLGLSFDIDAVPPAGLRVELANPGTAKSAAFWGGDANMLSPVHVGHNELRWADVTGPFYLPARPVFDPTQIAGLRFHVPSNATAATNYTFCIANLAAIL